MSIRSFALASVVLMASAMAGEGVAARDNPFPEIMTWPMPQAVIMKRDYGSVASCGQLQSSYDAQGWPQGVGLETLQQIDRRLKQRVFLRPDQGPDTWTPLTRTVIEGKRKPAADCDDVAVTGAQLAVCAGFPSDRLGLLVTQLPSRQNELHVVAFYNDDQTGVWIFGDTMARPRAFSALGQTVHFYAFLDDVTEWWALRDPMTGRRLTGALATSSIPEAAEPTDMDSGTCKHPHF